jgi:hypothetical protein
MRPFNFSNIALRNESPLLVGSLLLLISCSLHDTSYLQAGDAADGGAGGAGPDSDSGGSRVTGGSAGTTAAQGGSAAGGSTEGGSPEGGDPSTAGSAATGGSDIAGTGATGPCGGAQVKCATSNVITDFESNDGHLCVQSSGTVIAYGDGTGTQSPEIGDVKAYDASDDCDRGSAFALHALGGGAKDYGFGVALRLPQNVDAVKAGYKGIRFRAKAAVARKISIKVAIPGTLDASFGGSCVPTQSPMKLCNDHPAAAVVVAAGGWLKYDVAFSALRQEGWGVYAEPNYEAISQIHVVFPGPVSGGSADFDVWLDDFEFYE